VLGVQWHAETMADARLFEALVGAAAAAPLSVAA
jgi:gamma-glutamyl-gamma-aminobutyrate hydrolase PuuD